MTPRRSDVRLRFDRAADTFDGADFVHRHTGDGLLERMMPMQVEAERVLELGSATGTMSRQLRRQYRGSRILSVDLSYAMLHVARRKHSRFSRIAELQADATAIPLRAGSVDVVVANLLLPWIDDVPATFTEVARVLRREGLFAFSSLGPDSLALLRDAFGDGAHVHRFPDMHDVGDALVRAGLSDPVLDVDRLTIDYNDIARLYGDLGACGARNTLAGRQRSLTGKARWRRAEERLRGAMTAGKLQLELELVYGHAWGGGPASPDGEYRFDIAAVGHRR